MSIDKARGLSGTLVLQTECKLRHAGRGGHHRPCRLCCASRWGWYGTTTAGRDSTSAATYSIAFFVRRTKEVINHQAHLCVFQDFDSGPMSCSASTPQSDLIFPSCVTRILGSLIGTAACDMYKKTACRFASRVKNSSETSSISRRSRNLPVVALTRDWQKTLPLTPTTPRTCPCSLPPPAKQTFSTPPHRISPAPAAPKFPFFLL